MHTLAKIAAAVAALPLIVGCSSPEVSPTQPPSLSPPETAAASLDPDLPYDVQMRRAIEGGDEELVLEILEVGVSLDGPLANGLPPLHYAAQRQQDSVLLLLLAEGASTQTIDNQGRTPLMVAAAYSGPDAVRALLDAGAEMDVYNMAFFGASPWHYAANYGNVGALEVFLEYGQEVNALDANSRSTALHWAAFTGELGAVEFLLAAGIDTEMVDSSGSTARAWAEFHGATDVVDAIVAAGGVA